MIAIIDYEMGNLRSVQRPGKAGAQTVITDRAVDLKEADKIVLPVSAPSGRRWKNLRA